MAIIVATRKELEQGITVNLGERTQIFLQPICTCASIVGALFDTNKTFLLPQAIPALKEVFLTAQRVAAAEALLVGHTDATGEPEVNNPLSLERADSAAQWLKGEVDKWLLNYEVNVPSPKRWGKREDRLMLRYLPDFDQRDTKGGTGSPNARSEAARPDPLVEWFQKTRDLKVDGIAGPETRTQLITEYFVLTRPKLEPMPSEANGAGAGAGDDSQTAESGAVGDTVSRADIVPVECTTLTHGAGENFPLSTIEPLLPQPTETQGTNSEAAAENAEDPVDRRVDFFFFTQQEGVAPAPGEPDGPEYLEWVKQAKIRKELRVAGKRRTVHLLELHDALFRLNSCVMLPEGETPIGDKAGQAEGHESVESVGIMAATLRFNEEHVGKRLLIAGHTDTSGTVDFNQPLSEERAEVAFCILMGERERFKELVDKRHRVSDYKQLLSWCSRAFPNLFQCDPGTIDDQEFTGIEPLKLFQAQYNAAKLEIRPDTVGSGESAEPPDLAVDGDIGPFTWGAMFDVYQLGIRDELGEKQEDVQKLRERLTFLAEDLQHVGFSEHHAIAQQGKDNFRSQSNRRVELLFFDEGEEPLLDILREEPDITELYTSGDYVRRFTNMVSAKRWVAEWADEFAAFELPALMQVQAPGCPGGVEMELQILITDFGQLDTLSVLSAANRIEGEFDQWDAPDDPPFVGEMQPEDEFPVISFEFIVEGGGRRVPSRNKIPYEDRIDMKLEIDDDGETLVIANQPYVLATMFGKRNGRTSADGVVLEERIPPGAVQLFLRNTIDLETDVLPHGWDLEEL